MALAWRHSKNVKFGNIRQKIQRVIPEKRGLMLLNSLMDTYLIIKRHFRDS